MLRGAQCFFDPVRQGRCSVRDQLLHDSVKHEGLLNKEVTGHSMTKSDNKGAQAEASRLFPTQADEEQKGRDGRSEGRGAAAAAPAGAAAAMTARVEAGPEGRGRGSIHARGEVAEGGGPGGKQAQWLMSFLG